MLINYRDADGRVIELEVTEEVGQFYLTSLDQERKNERRETRRHTLLSTFTYEDKDYFDSGVDICQELALYFVHRLARYRQSQRALFGLSPRARAYQILFVHLTARITTASTSPQGPAAKL